MLQVIEYPLSTPVSTHRQVIVFTGHGEASEGAKVTCEIVGEHGESGTLSLSR